MIYFNVTPETTKAFDQLMTWARQQALPEFGRRVRVEFSSEPLPFLIHTTDMTGIIAGVYFVEPQCDRFAGIRASDCPECKPLAKTRIL
jgi:hypothetical protein